MFELADGYRDRGMAAYSGLQQREFANEAAGYTATRHQREVGTGYFDTVATVISNGQSSTTAMKESTETAQFAIIDFCLAPLALDSGSEAEREVRRRLEHVIKTYQTKLAVASAPTTVDF
eukprot:gene10632-14252_t